MSQIWKEYQKIIKTNIVTLIVLLQHKIQEVVIKKCLMKKYLKKIKWKDRKINKEK